jgi:hypothetical protein
MAPTVFISYSSTDEKKALTVCTYLEERGVNCWIAPRDVLPGMDWTEALMGAITECKGLVLIFSAEANRSVAVKREVQNAASKGKVIVPVKIDDATPSRAMEFVIGNTHWLDAMHEPFESHLDRLLVSVTTLVNAIESISGRPPVVAPRPPAPPVRESHAAPAADATPRPSPPEGDAEGVDEPPSDDVEMPDVGFPLEHLQPNARGVVEHALMLAKRCRDHEVTHRVMLAALVADSTGYAARACRHAGVDPHLLWALLVAMSTDWGAPNDDDWLNVTLPPTATTRVLLPTLKRASRSAGNAREISEPELFRAFCDQVDAPFSDFLKVRKEHEALEQVELDLGELRGVSPDRPWALAGLTLRARRVIRLAHTMAQRHGVQPIPNRLVLASFLHDERGFAQRVLASQCIYVPQLGEALNASARGPAPTEYPLTAEARARIVTPMIKRARELAGDGEFVTERLLFRGFCEVAEPLMKTELKTLGIDLDALAACEPSDSSPESEAAATSTPPTTPSKQRAYDPEEV